MVWGWGVGVVLVRMMVTGLGRSFGGAGWVLIHRFASALSMAAQRFFLSVCQVPSRTLWGV